MNNTLLLLSKEDLGEIKEKLQKEKDRLERELGQFADPKEKNKDDYDARFPEFGNKDDENAAEVAVYSDRLSLEHSLESELGDIKKTVARIEEGTYGTCKYCKQPIERGRLLARPTSSSCVACKKELKGE